MEESGASTAVHQAGSGADLIAQQEPPPPPKDAGGEESVDVADDNFEFAFAVKDDAPDAWPGITADEIFSNGFIRPSYPVFGCFLLAPAPAEEKKAARARPTLRSLFVEERAEDARSSPEAAERQLEGISPATYCVWRPGSSPARPPPSCKKSRSMGSSFRWRLRDLVVGRSQRKEKFVFLPAEMKSRDKRNPGRATKDAAAAAAKKATEVDAVGSHGFHYGSGSRRSVLPYKEELVGFLADVNALGRTHPPF